MLLRGTDTVTGPALARRASGSTSEPAPAMDTRASETRCSASGPVAGQRLPLSGEPRRPARPPPTCACERSPIADPIAGQPVTQGHQGTRRQGSTNRLYVVVRGSMIIRYAQ